MNWLPVAAAQGGVTEFPGWDGFLGTRASLMMDLVVVAMAFVLVVLVWSVRLPRQRRYVLHKRVQLALAALLLVAVAAFEVDVRIHGWRERSAGQLGGSPSSAAWAALVIHLFFAVTTVVLWPVVIWRAMRRFPTPPEPGDHSPNHRRWARLAAWDMAATTFTGWGFYYIAFVAN